MPFDLGSTINNATSWVSTSPIIGAVVANPFYTALLLTAISMIIIVSVYPSLKKNKTSEGLRAFIYMFVAVLVVLFIHYYSLKASMTDNYSQQGVREVFSSIQTSQMLQPSVFQPSSEQPFNETKIVTGSSENNGGCGCDRSDNIDVTPVDITTFFR